MSDAGVHYRSQELERACGNDEQNAILSADAGLHREYCVLTAKGSYGGDIDRWNAAILKSFGITGSKLVNTNFDRPKHDIDKENPAMATLAEVSEVAQGTVKSEGFELDTNFDIDEAIKNIENPVTALAREDDKGAQGTAVFANTAFSINNDNSLAGSNLNQQWIGQIILD